MADPGCILCVHISGDLENLIQQLFYYNFKLRSRVNSIILDKLAHTIDHIVDYILTYILAQSLSL